MDAIGGSLPALTEHFPEVLAGPETVAAVRKVLAAEAVFNRTPRVRAKPGDPTVHNYTCIPAPAYERWADYIRCGGAGFTEEQAWVAAVGEGLERYASVRYSLRRRGDLPRPWRALCGDAPHPDLWSLFSSNQYAEAGFPCRPFTEDTPVQWVHGVEVGSGRHVLLPGPMVCLPYPRAAGEARITVPTSTGLAFGTSKASALLSALLEVVERDAVVLAWHWGLPAGRIPAENPILRELCGRVGLDGDRYQVHAFDVTTDVGVPTAAVVIRLDEGPRPITAVGSACRPSLFHAVKKALLEAAQGVPYVRSLCRTLADPEWTGSFQGVRSFQHSAVFHTLFPQHLERRVADLGDFLITDRVAELTADGQTSTPATVAAQVRKTGYVPCAVDITPTSFSATDCAVVRVVVPGLYSLEGSYRLRPMAPERADGVAHRLGRVLTPSDLPHPLP